MKLYFNATDFFSDFIYLIFKWEKTAIIMLRLKCSVLNGTSPSGIILSGILKLSYNISEIFAQDQKICNKV